MQIVIKILMKENPQPLIITEEQLLTAFISGELRGKPEKPLHHHAICVFGAVIVLKGDQNLKSPPAFLSKSWRRKPASGDRDLGGPPPRSHFQMFSLWCMFGQERKGTSSREENSPLYITGTQQCCFIPPKFSW